MEQHIADIDVHMVGTVRHEMAMSPLLLPVHEIKQYGGDSCVVRRVLVRICALTLGSPVLGDRLGLVRLLPDRAQKNGSQERHVTLDMYCARHLHIVLDGQPFEKEIKQLTTEPPRLI